MAQKRIQLVIAVERAGELIAAQIESPDDKRVRLDLLRDFAVGLILILLARKRGPVQVKKFRPVKADAFRAVAGGSFDIIRQLNVGREHDVAAVSRRRFGFAQTAELLGNEGAFLLQLAEIDPALTQTLLSEAASSVGQKGIARRTLLELNEETCRWPIGDPGHPDFFFCGGQTITGLPYCAYHSRVAYQPAHMRRDRRPFRG